MKSLRVRRATYVLEGALLAPRADPLVRLSSDGRRSRAWRGFKGVNPVLLGPLGEWHREVGGPGRAEVIGCLASCAQLRLLRFALVLFFLMWSWHAYLLPLRAFYASLGPCGGIGSLRCAAGGVEDTASLLPYLMTTLSCIIPCFEHPHFAQCLSSRLGLAR